MISPCPLHTLLSLKHLPSHTASHIALISGYKFVLMRAVEMVHAGDVFPRSTIEKLVALDVVVGRQETLPLHSMGYPQCRCVSVGPVPKRTGPVSKVSGCGNSVEGRQKGCCC